MNFISVKKHVDLMRLSLPWSPSILHSQFSWRRGGNIFYMWSVTLDSQLRLTTRKALVATLMPRGYLCNFNDRKHNDSISCCLLQVFITWNLFVHVVFAPLTGIYIKKLKRSDRVEKFKKRTAKTESILDSLFFLCQLPLLN